MEARLPTVLPAGRGGGRLYCPLGGDGGPALGLRWTRDSGVRDRRRGLGMRDRPVNGTSYVDAT